MEIKVVGNIIGYTTLNRYSNEDVALFTPYDRVVNFNPKTDFIESYIYDIVGNPLTFNPDFLNYTSGKESSLNPDGTFNTLEFDPISDLRSYNYTSGEFVLTYNFFRKLQDNSSLFIKEISSDRTEIKLGTLSDGADVSLIQYKLKSILETPYSQEFILDIGNNRQYLIINSYVDGTDLILKLYSAIEPTVFIKTNVNIYEELISSISFEVNLDKLIIPDLAPSLRGPNFDIEVKDTNLNTTQYESYFSLTNTSTSGSYQQLISDLNNDSGVQINVDYTSFENFIHFSSAALRVEILKDKFTNILSFEDQIANNIGNILLISKLKTSINQIILSFDGFEKFHYFSNDDKAWPKTNGHIDPPSIWYDNYHDSAIAYDNKNHDRLTNHIPNYLIEDENNLPYLQFTDMMGHFFDGIWVRIKSITDLYRNENALQKGISRDLLYLQLKSLGLNITSNPSDDSLFSQLLGGKDISDEKYKRIYNNLPYLIQSKGTVNGLKALITCFGIPETILDVKEFGGDNKNILPNTGNSFFTKDKIRVEDNEIDGNILTPYISLEKPLNDKLNDINLIDVSFSLSKKVNENILITYPNFNIDNLIGDPSDLYESKYVNLENTKYDYFIVNGKKYKYNEFIEILKYIDNSLFGLLKDFIPGRAAATLGAVVESNILERNKVKNHKPRVEIQPVRDAKFNGPVISEDITSLYDKLENSKDYYTGELPGSELEVNETYGTLENPYKESNVTGSYSDFTHSDFPAILMVSGSLVSRNRKKLEKEILTKAELQDSYNTLTTYNRARYKGVKTQSKLYNKYTNGDVSFGKTAAIDNYVNKIALFNEISTNLFLGKTKNDVVIKYLVDKDGNLTELNKQNDNWFEVQNTFKSYSNLTISLFDVKKFSNQKTTEGVKDIYISGYSYEPILYYSTESDILNFQIPGFLPSLRVLAKNNQPTGSIYKVGEVTPYKLNSYNIVSNIFDMDDEMSPIDNYKTGSFNSDNVNEYPTYIASADSSYTINSNLKIDAQLLNNSSGYVTYALRLYKNLINANLNNSTPIAEVSKTLANIGGGYYVSPTNKIYLERTDGANSNLSGGLGIIIETSNDYHNGYRINEFWIHGISNATGGECVVITGPSETGGKNLYIPVDQNVLDAPNNNEKVLRFRNKVVDMINTYYNSWIGGTGNYRLRGIDLRDTNSDGFKIILYTYTNSGHGYINISTRILYKELTGTDSIKLSKDLIDTNTNSVILSSQTLLYKYQIKEIDTINNTISNFKTVYSKFSKVRLNLQIQGGNSNVYTPKFNGNIDYINYDYYYLNLDDNNQFYVIPDNSLGNIVNNGNILDLSMSVNNVFLKNGDKLTFVLQQAAVYPGFEYTTKLIGDSTLSINGDPNNRSINNTITTLLEPSYSILNDNGYTKLVFNEDLTTIYTLNSSGEVFFTPDTETENEVMLWNKYGDINYRFGLTTNDVILIRDINNYVYEFAIKSINIVNNRLEITLNTVIDSNLYNNIMSTNENKRYYEILFMIKVKDETNIILSFNKKDGKVSWGFIIPENLNPEILANIDTITKEVKQKLLDEQSIIDQINGGAY